MNPLARVFSQPALRLTLLLTLGALVPVATVDCGGGGTGGAGGQGGGGGNSDCVGGVIIDGVCEGICDPALCVAGNICVANRCVLACDSHEDCLPDGTQSCLPAVEDETMAAVTVCASSGKLGIGAACPLGTECDATFTCPDGAACGASLCGGLECVADPALCPDGQAGCNLGKCPDDSLCAVPTCDAAACAPLTCNSSGQGDAEAYCTTAACATDADCVPGFECALLHEGGTLCNVNNIGNHPSCGTVGGSACIPEAELAGLGLTEGSLCLMRGMCLKKTECSSCETDLDCSFSINKYCTDLGGSKVCARACASDDDCFPDFQCTGGAGDRCVPRFGACVGTGGFCEPCRNDLDCGAAGSGNACIELSQGRHACFDLNFPDLCAIDGDCPDSPGGKSGECFDAAEGLAPGDSLYHHCYVPKNEGSQRYSCW